MTSTRPYLLRALFDWIVDNDLTPYLMVNAESEDVSVPVEYIEDGRIILNISTSATHELAIENESVSFSARFAGKPMQVYVPMHAVMAIYAKENGQGMMFSEDNDDGDEPPTDPSPENDGTEKSGPKLKLVK